MLLVVGVATYLLVRNEWVFKVRTKLLFEDIEEYMKLPEYTTMVYTKPFAWDIEEFLK